MVNRTAPRWTVGPQPPRPRRSDVGAAQVLPDLGPHGPVLYASDLAGPGAKERLVRRLLSSLPARKTGGMERLDKGPVILETTVLGQPRLRLNGQPGPAVSFSQAAGCLWAAFTFAGQVGVDAALPSEFEENYPWARAFRPAELDWARPLTGSDTAGAAALLWALKEAAVKALGVGFHLLDPLAVEAVSPRPWQGWVRVLVTAGQILPASGTVFFSVNDHDKPAAADLARRYVELGFKIVATEGTANVLEKAGLTVERVFKVKEGRPNVVDLIKGDRIQLIINTPRGQDTFFDEKAIRRAAVLARIPTITTIAAAQAAVEGINAMQHRETSVFALQHLHAVTCG